MYSTHFGLPPVFSTLAPLMKNSYQFVVWQHITPSADRHATQPYELFFEATDMGETGEARQQLGKRLGQRIAERRKELSWTQDQLAERLGVDTETISRFERGVTVPALLTIEKLAGILKTSVANLLSEASISLSDQAIRISAWLASLPPEDGEFIVAHVKTLCDHMRQVRLDAAIGDKTSR